MEGPAEALFIFFALDFAVQWVSCVFSAILQTEIFFDVVGASTFLVGALVSIALGGTFHERQVMATTMVCVWALRLGTYLFMRILQAGKDSRFDGVRDVPLVLFAYWTIQGVWVFFVVSPVVALNTCPQNSGWGQPTDLLGLFLWAVGFLVEVVADYQKFFFRMEEANKDKWMSTGLWSLCRHPNYTGEMVLWWGMYILCCGGLNSVLLRAAGLVSPLFTMYMLTSISGAPLLERSGGKKWGALSEYQEYLERTPLFLPRFSWRKSKTE